MKGLGETIKSLRIEKGLTQPQLAKLVGVSNGMISIWENNINEPKASYLKALAVALDNSEKYAEAIQNYEKFISLKGNEKDEMTNFSINRTKELKEYLSQVNGNKK